MIETYQHSGRIGVLGIPLMLIAGIGSAIVLGVVYAYVLAWIPIVYVSFLATGGFGALTGLIVGWSSRAAHVRNTMITGIMGLFAAALGMYVAWAFDGTARFGGDEVPVLLNPVLLKEYIAVFYENGFWGFGRGNANATVSGIPLGLIWLAEAGIVIGLSFLISTGFASDHPYCEACQRWTDRTEGFCKLTPPTDDDTVVEQLVAGDLNVLNRFQRSPENAAAFLRIDTAQCPDCSQCNWVTISLAQITVDKDGKENTSVDALVSNMLVTDSEMERLRQTVDQLEVATLPAPDDQEDDEVAEVDESRPSTE